MPVLRCVLPMLHLEKLCSVNVKMPALQQKTDHGTPYNDHKQLEDGGDVVSASRAVVM